MRYVLYHSNCYDGFGAAFAAWKKFGSEGTNYIPVSYGYPPPEMPAATRIYIVDFSYPAEVLKKLAENAIVTVLDHHKTAKEALAPLIGAKGNLEVLFDMDKSGARMTWEYLHPQERCPDLIDYISDRDLWRFELPGSERVHKALVSYPMDFSVWASLSIEGLKKEGVVCERLYEQLVDNIVKSAWIGELDGMKVPMVNTSIAWSEVGHALLEKNPDYPMAASFTVFRDQVMWSLRSRPDFDCSAVAKKFGGGGHKNAAGFKTARF
jgi:oligoribonuclease NrnB/cAMP/cGMP phosphodiesterase (DHH superfamily)